MKGYFISQEEATKLGLLENSAVSLNLQKVIIAITENDVVEYQMSNEKKVQILSEQKIEETANWFYRNYYDSFLETNF